MNKVTSNKYFKPGDTVEECSLTVVREVPPSMATHTFYIDRVKKSIVDGNACLYKHEKNPNLKYSYTKSEVEIKNGKPVVKGRKVIFTAIKKIKKGEELTINYKQSGSIKKEWSDRDGGV